MRRVTTPHIRGVEQRNKLKLGKVQNINPFNPVDLKRGRKFFSTSEKWKKFVFPCFAELFLCAFYLIPKPDFVLYKKTVEN